MNPKINNIGVLKFVGAAAMLLAFVATGAATEHHGEFADIFDEEDQDREATIVVGENASAMDVVGGIDIAHALGAAQADTMDDELNDENETGEFNESDDELNETNQDNQANQDDLNDNGNQDELNETNQDNQANQDGLNDNDYVGALDSDDNIQQTTEEETIILIGGPNVNDLTRDLAEQNLTRGADEYVEGEGYIHVIPDGFAQGHNVMIVSGYEGEETREAARYVVDNPGEIEPESNITVPTE